MTTLASIKADAKTRSENLETLNVKFDTFVENSNIDTRSNDVSSLKKTVSMLCARLERSDTIVARLSMELTEMKYNLIFNFDKTNADCNEAEGENCIALVKHFLATVMSVPNAQLIYVPVAHRLGQRRPGRIRPILAKFPNVNELQTVPKHTNRLRGTKHFVQRQMPPDVTERKNFALDEFKVERGDVQNKEYGSSHTTSVKL
ncbi:hypothetical protein LSH36_1105g00058 [Paralvinella palmiformis]|uniref:Uncharacterized protein n=1 Tax=Paralvinella palmiformis TaxID=53620 RepID=A0AAD9MSI5_9ANNE|nr:hypothetical protein LSH36_1105g00058 [Paralvinella palmiformis]